MKTKTPQENSSFSCAWTWRILSLFSVSCLSLRAAIFTRLRIRCALLSFGWGKWGTSCTLVPFLLSLALRETVIYFVSRESQWLRPKKKEFVVRWRNAYYSYLPSTYVHTCGHETLSSIVWTLIPYVTLHFIEIGAAHNRALALSRPRALAPSRPRALASFRRNHRSYMYVWTEALSGMVFVLAQKLSGLVST